MKFYLVFKRILDFVFSLILLIVVMPVMILAAITIKIEDPKGPVLFMQQRPGQNAKIFKVCKFRTMRIETEKNGISLTDMERMTRIGSLLRKTSIDELPQLFNILRGEMSFIGPRPLLVQYLEHYSLEQMRRHEITPGISGWAQVNGRNTISWEEKFKHDVWYVDNISFFLDLKIIWLTICNVLRRKHINHSQGSTMPIFSKEQKNIRETR
ncbi:sugar transferase [Metabacillus fastidiosus]|uniref:sugar transferase n=1 Tax=Metabacillus fastidiosus TaxID=1458 RepID=UPI002DC05395|nr:sugar transferase [Metabacillus fastidiosus]MEC2076062.1 sugar transferase [Metabacillus fastidiosus]